MLPDLVVLSLATATVSVTVTQSKLFKPLRNWIESKSEWLGDLTSCAYCFGHWVALAFTCEQAYQQGLYNQGLTSPEWFALLTLWLAVTAGAALISGTIGRLFAE